MRTTVYFYTGTGNSLWTARKLSEKLENTELVSIARAGGGFIHTESPRVGIVFPVHIWGLSGLVVDFVRRLEANSDKYYFALAVNAGQVAATLVQLRRLMNQKGLLLHCGFSIVLPSNYIPWGGAILEEKQQKLFGGALAKIEEIAEVIRSGQMKEPERGSLWQNVFFSALYRLTFAQVGKMDKSFWSDEKCNGCRVCEIICPLKNIIVDGKKPVWQHLCDQCFACLQWCPEEAIQYGRNTQSKKRYRHPEIKVNDMLSSAPLGK